MVNNQIVHVNDTNFQYEVISFSQNTPVIVEFNADWCRDCRTYYPMLDRMILEEAPHLRLAKINVDENPNTTLRFSVRSLPNVKAFSYARVVDQITGVVPQSRIAQMLLTVKSISENTLTMEKAQNLWEDESYLESEREFREYLVTNPDSDIALLGLGKSLLAQQKYQEAAEALKHFPSSRMSDTAELLSKFAELMQQYHQNQLPSGNTLEATFQTSLRLVQLKNFEAALDGLLDILKQNKAFRHGDAKSVFLAILEVFPESRIDARKYRMELSSVLF